MKFKNLVQNGDGTFNIDLEHPTFGWIPFTASAEDSMPHGREIHRQLALATGTEGVIE